MDFHVFVFWNHGLYVSRIYKQTIIQKTHKNLKILKKI